MRITSSFANYNDRIIEDAMHFRNSIATTFWYALRMYDLLLIVTKSKNIVKYSIASVTEGLFFLRKHVPSALTHPIAQSSKYLPLFKLPPELRSRIYELVFRFPNSGIRVNGQAGRLKETHRASDQKLFIMSRDMEKPVGCREWQVATNNTYPDRRLSLHPYFMDEALALLLVSRQIHRETVGIFYSTNRFHSASIYDLENMLKALVPDRRNFLTHITFRYDEIYHEKALRLFPAVAKLKGPKKTGMHIDEARWSKGHPVQDEWSGLSILADMKGVEVFEFEGDCGEVAASFKKKVGAGVTVNANGAVLRIVGD